VISAAWLNRGARGGAPAPSSYSEDELVGGNQVWPRRSNRTSVRETRRDDEDICVTGRALKPAGSRNGAPTLKRGRNQRRLGCPATPAPEGRVALSRVPAYSLSVLAAGRISATGCVARLGVGVRADPRGITSAEVSAPASTHGARHGRRGGLCPRWLACRPVGSGRSAWRVTARVRGATPDGGCGDRIQGGQGEAAPHRRDTAQASSTGPPAGQGTSDRP